MSFTIRHCHIFSTHILLQMWNVQPSLWIKYTHRWLRGANNCSRNMGTVFIFLSHASLPDPPLGAAYLCTHVYMCEGQCEALWVCRLSKEIIWEQEPCDSSAACQSLWTFPLGCIQNKINIQNLAAKVNEIWAQQVANMLKYIINVSLTSD